MLAISTEQAHRWFVVSLYCALSWNGRRYLTSPNVPTHVP